MKSIWKDSFALSSDYDGNGITDTVLESLSLGTWSTISKECYVAENKENTLLLNVKGMNHSSSKFGLRLLVLDTNKDVFKISIDSSDLSKYYKKFRLLR